MTVISDFIHLFQGNRSAIGTEEGGCLRLRGDFDTCAVGHLDGSLTPIGVYPMVQMGDWLRASEQWGVHWGCIDFDEGEEESLIHARNVQGLCKALGVAAWVERSRSKGYHVWVFAEQWVPAKLMREALLGACQVVDAPTKEINPKQVALQEGQLGNYVRLPYPGALSSALQVDLRDLRRVMIAENGATYDLYEFVSTAIANRVPTDKLEKLQGLYAPPLQRVITRDWGAIERPGSAFDRLAGKARIIFEDGPIGGAFRGHTLYKLACYLQEDGKHTPEEALELLRDADIRWGKFHDRPDCELRLQEMVNKAWARLP